MKKYLHLFFPIFVFFISQATGIYGKYEPREFDVKFDIINYLFFLLPYMIWIARVNIKNYSDTVLYSGFFAIHAALIFMQVGIYRQTQAGDAGMAFYMFSLGLCTLTSLIARRFERWKAGV
jgi:hypothetical protein